MAEGDQREELFELYKLAIEDYRFQVTLNWNRTQYYLTLSVAIIGAGTGILKLGDPRSTKLLTSCIFFVGVLVACFAIFASAKQHGYYRRVRSRVRVAEERLGIDPALAVRTTAGQRGEPPVGIGRRLTVTNVNHGVLVVLAAIDLVAFLYVLFR